MFTGLVEATGVVRSVRRQAGGARLSIESELEGLSIGESVSVDGACQTVVSIDGRAFACDVLPETLRVTTLGSLRPGAVVNLERALASGGRLGGHIVNGHVDGVGTVTRVTRRPLSIEIAVAPVLARYLVPKGSIAVNGVSLTVGPAVRGGRFAVFVIPHTWERTNLSRCRSGGAVNIEIDIVAKYVERIVSAKGSEPS